MKPAKGRKKELLGEEANSQRILREEVEELKREGGESFYVTPERNVKLLD